MNDSHQCEIAYAKVNLALHVRSRRADGYHELETLFAFVDAGDGLCATEADAFSLRITGRFAPDLAGEGDNLVLRAAKALGHPGGLAFTLDKRLPVASGIGGGSADAGAAIRLARRIWGSEEAATDLARLGADVPACIMSHTCFGTGVGDQLTQIDLPGLAGTSVLLVNPRVACPTGPVFRAWDGIDRGPLDPANWRNARNDLESPAIALVPAIGGVLEALRPTGAHLVRMSGSGATCFALYDYAEARDLAAQQIAKRHPWLVDNEGSIAMMVQLPQEATNTSLQSFVIPADARIQPGRQAPTSAPGAQPGFPRPRE